MGSSGTCRFPWGAKQLQLIYCRQRCRRTKQSWRIGKHIKQLKKQREAVFKLSVSVCHHSSVFFCVCHCLYAWNKDVLGWFVHIFWHICMLGTLDHDTYNQRYIARICMLLPNVCISVMSTLSSWTLVLVFAVTGVFMIIAQPFSANSWCNWLSSWHTEHTVKSIDTRLSAQRIKMWVPCEKVKQHQINHR